VDIGVALIGNLAELLHDLLRDTWWPGMDGPQRAGGGGEEKELVSRSDTPITIGLWPCEYDCAL
jgi:hypothetical protein